MTPETASVLAPAATQAWWKDSTVYQIYPRSFADSNGDGIGDLRGIINRLDYLAELGVEVLWLSPIYPSPQDDNGYDISNYRDIEPMFGTMSDFTELLEQTHARGMKLIMDLVVNHTSDEHPWFLESRDPQSPKRDWYWWRAAKPGAEPGTDAAAPTNWGSRFSGSAWEYDAVSGEYFLHIFSRRQPDLNWENPEVRAAVHAMMNRWLDRGVDGFRMDVINLVSKRLEQVDGTVPVSGLGFEMGPRLHEFMQEMHAAVLAGRDSDLLTVGEMPGVTVEEARLFTDPDRHELDMVFQFEHVGLDQGEDKYHPRPLDLVALKRSLGRWQEALADVGWNSLYLSNHDQPRLVSRFGDDTSYRYESATLWAALLHMQRGTPYVYQGEEIGMTNVPFRTIDDFRDVEALGYHREKVVEQGLAEGPVLDGLRRMGRDNARTPVQWDATEHAGFTTGTPWIDVNPDYTLVNVASDRASERSVFAFYARLIALRHTEDTVALGRFVMLEPEHPRLYAYTRDGEGEQILVAGNVSGDPLDVPLLEQWAGAEVLVTNYGDVPTAPGATEPSGEPRASATAQGTTLAPWEVRVLRRVV